MRSLVPFVLLAFASTLACVKPYLAPRVDAPPHPAVPAGVVHATSTFGGEHGVTLFAVGGREKARESGPGRDWVLQDDHAAAFLVRRVFLSASASRRR